MTWRRVTSENLRAARRRTLVDVRRRAGKDSAAVHPSRRSRPMSKALVPLLVAATGMLSTPSQAGPNLSATRTVVGFQSLLPLPPLAIVEGQTGAAPEYVGEPAPSGTFRTTRVVSWILVGAGVAAAVTGLVYLSRDGKGTDCTLNRQGDRVCFAMYETTREGTSLVAGGAAFLLLGTAALLTVPVRW